MPDSALDLVETAGGTRLRLRVKPGARRNAILGVHAGALKVCVTAPREKGKANAAITRLLSEILDVPATDVEIVAGPASRDKAVVVRLPSRTVLERLKLPA